MIRLVFALRRKAGMSLAEFQDYWLRRHGGEPCEQRQGGERQGDATDGSAAHGPGVYAARLRGAARPRRRAAALGR